MNARTLVSVVAIFLVASLLPEAPLAVGMGINAGVRLLVHVEEYVSPPRGTAVNPCEMMMPEVSSPDELEVSYDGDADTLIVWVYAFRQDGLHVAAMQFGIEYAGLDVLAFGQCKGGRALSLDKGPAWPQSGAEGVFGWFGTDVLEGPMEPLLWFVVARTQRDGYFGVRSTTMIPPGGIVASPGTIPSEDRIVAYGRVGIGSEPGTLPLPDRSFVPAAWGGCSVSIR